MYCTGLVNGTRGTISKIVFANVAVPGRDLPAVVFIQFADYSGQC